MKTLSPQYPEGHKRHGDTEKNKPIRRGMVYGCSAWIFSVSLCLCGSGFAAPSSPNLPGRLFYTPQQRAQLQDARRRNQTVIRPAATTVPAPVSFDGLVLRSDGATTHWVNGRARRGAPPASLQSLKPGQIRADHRVYEPYQVLRPADAATVATPSQETKP